MDVNRRLADILAQYTDTMSRIDNPPKEVNQTDCKGRLLKPADKQRPYVPPTYGHDRPARSGLE
jgi:hypothetical protein